MPPTNTQPRVIKDQFGNLVLAPTGMAAAGNGQLLDVGSSATSPAGAAVGGANPDAAKMAGTPNQTSAPTILPQSPPPNAARVTTEGTQLRDVLRQESAAAPRATDAQVEKQAEAARFQKQFGDLGSRVQNLIATAVAPPPAAQQAPATTDISKLTAAQQAAVQAYASHPSVETYAAAKQALGGAEPNQYIQASDSTAVAKQLADASPDQIHMTDDVVAQMGYDAHTLASTLGIAPAALAGMTIQQFQAAVDQRLAQDQTDVNQLRALLADPSLGANERAMARKQLADLGATGVYASEQQLDQLRQSVADADTVEFNGQQYTVEELLSDDAMSGVITNYLDDPKFAASLREREPKFAAYIDQHAAAMRELTLHTTDAAKQFDEVSTANSDIKSRLEVAGLDQSGIDALIEAVSPGAGSAYSTTKIDLSGFPSLQALVDPHAAAKMPGVDIHTLATNFADAGSISPDVVRDLASKSPAQLAAIGAGGVDDASRGKFRNYLNYHADVAALDALDTHDPHALAQYLFGDPSVDLAAKLKHTAAHGRTGYHEAVHSALDSSPKDGKLDTPEQIAKNIRALLGPQDPAKIKDALAPNVVELLRGGRAAFESEYKRLGGGKGYYDSRGDWHEGERRAPLETLISRGPLTPPPPVEAQAPTTSGSGPAQPVPFQDDGKNDANPENQITTIAEKASDPGGVVSKTTNRWRRRK